MADPKFNRNKPMVTPKGVAAYAWLTRPDTKFDEDGQFKTNLIFDADDEGFVAFQKRVQAIHKDAVAAVKETLTAAKAKKVSVVNPFHPEEDDEGNPTGRVFIKAKSKAKQKMRDGRIVDVTLKIVDAKKNDLPDGTPVYGGSELKLAVRPAPYFMKGDCGITFYICGVQVITLESGGDASDMFDEEDGFEAEETDESDPFVADESEESAEDEEDDLY